MLFSVDGRLSFSRCAVLAVAAVLCWLATPADGQRKSPYEIAAFTRHTGPVRAVSVSPDRTRVATAGDDGSCYVMNVATMHVPLRRLEKANRPLTGVAFLENDKIAISATRDPNERASVWIWVPSGNLDVTALNDTDHDTVGLAHSPDGTRLGERFGNHAARCYTLTTNDRHGLESPKKHEICTAAAFGDDSDTFACIYSQMLVHWRLAPQVGPLGNGLVEGQSGVFDLAYLPGNQKIAAAHGDGVVRIYQVPRNQVFARLNGHRGAVLAVAVSPDGNLLATGGQDRDIRLWDLRRGAEIRKLTGHTSSVTDLQFIDDQRLVSCSLDGTVRQWAVLKRAADLELPPPLAGGSTDKPPMNPDDPSPSEPEEPTPPAIVVSIETASDGAVNQARKFRQQGKVEQAAAAYTAMIPLLEKEHGENSAKLLPYLREHAEAQRAVGKYDESAKIYMRCFKLSEPTIKRATTDPPDDLIQLAFTLASGGKDRDAVRGLQTVLESRRERLGKEHPAVADIYYAVGNLHFQRNDYVKASRYVEEALKLRREAIGPDHPDIVFDLIKLARCNELNEEIDKAGGRYKEALDVATRVFKAEDSRFAEAECRYASFLCSTGRPAEGTPLYHRSFRRIDQWPEDTASAAYVRSEQMVVCNIEHKFDKTVEVGDEALKLTRRLFGPLDYRLVDALIQLGWARLHLDQLDGAEECFQEGMTIASRRFGENAPQLAILTAYTAIVHAERGQDAEAEKVFKKAIELYEGMPGGAPTDAFGTYANLAALLLRQDRWDEGAQWHTNAVKSMRRSLLKNVPVLPDQTKFVYATVVIDALRNPLNHAARHRHRPEMARASAEWAANLKGVVTEVLAEQTLLARDIRDGEARKMFRELGVVRTQLAAMAVSTQPRPPELVEALKKKERELTARLGSEVQGRLKEDSWTTLAQMQAALDKDSVLIDFLQIRFQPSPAAPAEQYFVAWITPPKGKGEVDLEVIGRADDIKILLANYYREMYLAPRAIGAVGEAGAESNLDEAGNQLSELLVRKFPQLEKYSRWYVCPDEALWFVPWAALRTQRNRYVIEDHEITYLVSARQLTEKPDKKHRASAAVLVAAPDYNIGAPLGIRPMFTPLPGTAKEAAAVLPKLTDYTGGRPRVLVGQQAHEVAVRTVRNPQVLMLSTHGFFGSLNPNEDNDNPLLRCGLALAGANGATHSKRADGVDGVLTGLEVTGLDLRGTSLVVLSACQTGVGDLEKGQGVSGLKQAFQSAGAENIVSTLWPIPDDETADLMAKFFEHLAAKKRPAAALREAQIEIINERRKKNVAAHPYFWAAFGITGRGE